MKRQRKYPLFSVCSSLHPGARSPSRRTNPQAHPTSPTSFQFGRDFCRRHDNVRMIRAAAPTINRKCGLLHPYLLGSIWSMRWAANPGTALSRISVLVYFQPASWLSEKKHQKKLKEQVINAIIWKNQANLYATARLAEERLIGRIAKEDAQTISIEQFNIDQSRQTRHLVWRHL